MRYKFIIFFLFISFIGKAQVYQLMPQYGYDTKRMNFDSTIQIPTFCGVPKLGSNKINKGALAFDSCNNRFYYFNPKSQVWDTIKSADASLFVKYTDTAQMLLPYLRKVDTISLSNRIEGKIDSLKLSNDSIYARKNGEFVFQHMADTATVVKAFVRNAESFTINRGQVVYIFGASGDKASVKLADNSGDMTSSRTLGFVREDIAAGQTGWVTTQGQISKLQLGAYNEGDILWLDSIAGGFTKTKPVAPRHSVFLGVVERANNGNGVAYVKPQNGYEIGELHDVKITSPQTNQVLAYTTNIWENKNIYSIVDTTSLSNRINTKLNITDTANTWVTSVFRKTASDSVFFVRGGSNNFAYRDSLGSVSIGSGIGSATAGSVFYAGTGGTLRQSNTQFFYDSTQASLNIGTSTNVASAILNLSTTTKGFLQPRLSNSNMLNISTPAIGLSIFNTTDSVTYTYRGTTGGWQKNVIYNRTNDVALFNGANQRVMIDTVANTLSGRNLTIEAGNTISVGTTAFTGLSQTSRQWRGICVAPNGDVYATVFNGDIYRRAGGTGNFIALSQTSRQWLGIAAAPNGDIFAVVNSGDIYKRTGGTGNFVALGQTSRAWYGITVASDGSIYASVNGGDIYKSTDGGTTFSALGQTSRSYQDMHSVGLDVYVAVFNGDIFKQTGGTGNFVALGTTPSRLYRGITSSGADFYATTSETTGTNIYKQSNGTGNFIGYGFISNNQSITNASEGLYLTTNNGDIFLQGSGSSNLNGGTLVLQSGVGKGTGTSTINFNTGTTLSSGTTLQTASTKMTILGNGRVGIGTTSPSSILDVSSTTSAFLPPRMTTAQRDLITPVAGMVIYNTTTNKHQGYNGTTWNDFY